MSSFSVGTLLLIELENTAKLLKSGYLIQHVQI